MTLLPDESYDGQFYDGDDHEPEWREPWCTLCCDKQKVLVDGVLVDCPDCCPSEEEQARRNAEYRRAVAAGEINPEEDPF